MGRARARHVVKSGKGWAIRAPGAKRASATTRKQSTAIKRARTILKNLGGGELRTHGRNGRIRAADTVPKGHDPHPPRG